MKSKTLRNLCCSFIASVSILSCNYSNSNMPLLKDFDWEEFLSQHDMKWDQLTTDPEGPANDFKLKTGYYAGAIMGNGLLGTNLYKLKDNVYRLNVGRSDVKEARKPYNLYNSARLPIGYFTLSTVGNVQNEAMHLSLYNAVTTGKFTTDKGSIDFQTYVHSQKNYIIFETHSKGEEVDYMWNFVPQKAISPRTVFRGGQPANYLNHEGNSNPEATFSEEGENHYLIQPLVTDSSMTQIAKVYVVAWKEIKEKANRRIIATVAHENTQEEALQTARETLEAGSKESARKLLKSHKSWWNNFYQQAAFLSFPETRMESFYWAQYYKFASTTRPGFPIVDLQGVWPTFDTPWTAVWVNLNLQLTYSWQTKANMGWLSQPLWDCLYDNRDNLRNNVTAISGQESWTDAACVGRSASYDFASVLSPASAATNQYEVGNLTWLLLYYWQYCNAYGDDKQMTERLFPLLKSAINLYFHIRTEKDGKYGLPPTASPEYFVGKSVGPNSNYDLTSLRWGLMTLLDINEKYQLNDPMQAKWQDFLDNLVDYPYSDETGYKVSEMVEFKDTSHRHYSHLFMIYPYYLVNWGQKENRDKITLSINRWHGNQGYSRTGKAAMLLSIGDGNGALEEMHKFLDRFVKPNTLYAETGPVIETPLAAISTLHDFYMQDWGNTIRIFHGIPTSWTNASFANMRAKGAFLVSATREKGKTIYIRIDSEKGNTCQLQTEIPLNQLEISSSNGSLKEYQVVDESEGIIKFKTETGESLELTDKTIPARLPDKIQHPVSEWNYYGDRSQKQSVDNADQSK